LKKVYSHKRLLLVIGWFIYTVFFIAKSKGVTFHPIIQGYFSDFLALPLMLGVILLAMKAYTKDPTYQLSVAKVVVAFLYISIVFEWILPLYREHFHSDVWDVVAYGMGALLFLWIQSIGKRTT